MLNKNYIKINLRFNDGSNKSTSIPVKDAKLIINDKYIKSLFKKNDLSKTTSCSLNLSVSNIAVSITDFSIAKEFHINAINDVPSTISYLRADVPFLGITKQNIINLQLDCKRIFINKCHVEKLDIGKQFSKIENDIRNEQDDNIIITEPMIKYIEIRESYVDVVNTYTACKDAIIQSSTINILNLRCGLMLEFGKLGIFLFSKVGTLELLGNYNEIILFDASINSFIANICFIKKLELRRATVLNSFRFDKENFASFNINTWEILRKSAENEANLAMRAESSYNIVKINNSNDKLFSRILGKAFDFCSGYGYKPFRIVRSCICLIMLSFLTITINDIICLRFNGMSSVIANILVSFAGFAGQSGLSISDGFTFWVVTVANIIGIVLFAMLVNALFVRYRD